MSQLLQVVKHQVSKSQRILCSTLDITRGRDSLIEHTTFRAQHHFLKAPKILGNTTPALETFKLTPAHLAGSKHKLVCNEATRREYHLCALRTVRQQSTVINSQNNEIKQAACLGRWKTSKRCFADIFHKYQPIMNVPEGLFRGSVDRFNGITVDSSAEYESSGDFAEKLKKSIEFWQERKYRGLWFKIQTDHSDWIPHLTKQNFDFHHAKRGYVMMFRWLPNDEYVNIPQFAHTMIGVGCLVVNSKNEVLVVSERYALIPNSWKLPGGYVEPREDLVQAAIREVHEETGIDCEFKTVVSLRHSHRGGFGCSDMYVVVALTPLNEELKRCEREIAKIQWMPIAEYLQHPNVHETNRHFVRTLLDYEKRGIKFTCEKAQHQILKTDYTLYYMQAQENADEISANLSSHI